MEMEGSDMSQAQKDLAMRESLKVLSGIDMTLPPVGVSLILHDRLIEMGVARDPYNELKYISTSNVKDMIPVLDKMLDDTEDRYRLSALMAIAGNVIDYGAANQLDLEQTLMKGVGCGLGIDDMDRFNERLRNAKKISYYLDNSGEVILDGLFMKEIIMEYPSIVIDAYVKKVPLLNDVTKEDAEYAGLNEIRGVNIIEMEHEGWVSPEDIEKEKSDIVIVKGQGNYESLSEVKDIFFLLVVKCDVISGILGVDVGEMVFKKG